MATKKPIIFDYSNFISSENLNKIRIKTPETYNDYIIIPIKQKIHSKDSHHFAPLLFKTPKMYMPFAPNISSLQGGYIRLSFDNIKIDQHVKIFYEFINKLEDHLKTILIDSNIFPKNKVNIQKTIQNCEGYPDYFNLSFKKNEINVYDSNLDLIDIEDVKGKFYAFFVIELTSFYYNKKTKKLKLLWDIVQFKLDKIKTIIKQCLFLDETDLNSNSSTDEPKIIAPIKKHPELEKYFKMLSLGIPKMAIQLKMNILNIDPTFLDYSPETDLNSLPIALRNKLNSLTEPQSTEKPEIKSPHNIASLFGKNNNLLSNVKLKSVENIETNIESNIESNIEKGNNKKSNKNKIIDKSLPVPSLKEIQDAYNKIIKKPQNKTGLIPA
jgi:hypothetical protein